MVPVLSLCFYTGPSALKAVFLLWDSVLFFPAVSPSRPEALYSQVLLLGAGGSHSIEETVSCGFGWIFFEF